MKLRTKLIISFCIIIFVPVTFTALAMCGFRYFQLRDIANTYQVEDGNISYLTNTVQMWNRVTKDSCQKLLDTAESDPDKFLDMKYLMQVNETLQEKNSYLIVMRDNEEVYVGTNDLNTVPENLPDYMDTKTGGETGYFIDSDKQEMIKRIDFDFSDGSEGTLFVITSIKSLVPEMKELLIDIIISVLLILLLTAGMLTIWNYRSIITPIKKLEMATQNIKEGNLDFTLEIDSNDEIGELCQNFEEMRQRLKDSAEEKLASEKENRVLISNIAHDLKTPITAVKGYSEGLMDGVADTPEKRDKYIKTIYNKANEMDLLLNELTLYSKIDTNRIPYNFSKINVMEYFDDCVEEIGLDLEAKNIGLSYFNYAGDDVQIIADPEQLKRVIHNIINNSIKYLDKPKGFINIRVKDVGDFIQVEIEDNGKGIAKKDLPYIFDRFFRADTSRNSATGGSGIGLSIVRKIIEDHGGKIWATSKEETGTIMYFVLRKYQEVPNE